MKKLLGLIVMLIGLTAGCASQAPEPAAIALGDKPAVSIVFDGDVAPLLAAEDDYIKAFSAFDYAAKFKSEKPLDDSRRLELYTQALEPYTDKEKKRILAAFDTVLRRLGGTHVKLPGQILVFSEGQIEAGEAYTRQNAMCLPRKMMRFMTDKRLTELIAHETFHIISRTNPEAREEWYRILGYRQVNDIVWPKEIASLTIANPDAPQNNYVISCVYGGRQYTFMHVLYATEPYPIDSKKPFFKLLRDEMLAVEVVDNTPQPVYKDGKPLIVEKSELEGFTEQVGKNTKYTLHPEETTADHFAMLIMDRYPKAPNPEKVEALKALMFE